MGYYDSSYDQAIQEAEETARTIRNAYAIYVVIVFVVLAAILAALMISTIVALKKRADKQKDVNTALAREINAFAATRIFYCCDRATYKKPDIYKQMLAVDSKNNRLGLVDYESGKFKIVNYSQILNYEVYENGTIVANGMGVGGGLIGGFAVETNKVIKELRLIIRLKTADNPQVAYQIVASKGVFNLGIGKNSQIYRVCFPTVQEIVSLLQVIIDKNKNS